MNVLLINVHSFRNAGDQVLAEISIQQIRRCFSGCRVTVAMNDPESAVRTTVVEDDAVVDSFFTWFKKDLTPAKGSSLLMLGLSVWSIFASVLIAAWYRISGGRLLFLLPQRYRSAVAAYLSADAVVSCAGTLLHSRGHKLGLPILGPAWIMTYGWLCGKPMYMMPESIGPIFRGWERTLLRWLLSKYRVILLRDPNSRDLLDSLRLLDTRHLVAPDIAFLYEGALPEVGQELLDACGVGSDRPLLGVTLMDWGKQYPVFQYQSRYEQEVADAIRNFVQEYDGQAVLFPQVCGPTAADDDRIPSRRVLQMLAAHGVADRVHFVEEETPPEVLQSAYGNMDVFLGTRLHSNIFALTRHVPVVAIAYQDKTLGVMHMLGLDEWVIRIDDIRDGALIPLMRDLYCRRHAVQQHLRARVGDLQVEIDEIIDLIAADFYAVSR
jgi:colanic acid/amylovoran biosynthesis protein